MWRSLLEAAARTGTVIITDASAADVTRCRWTTESGDGNGRKSCKLTKKKWKNVIGNVLNKKKIQHRKEEERLSRVSLITFEIANSQRRGKYFFF